MFLSLPSAASVAHHQRCSNNSSSAKYMDKRVIAQRVLSALGVFTYSFDRGVDGDADILIADTSGCRQSIRPRMMIGEVVLRLLMMMVMLVIVTANAAAVVGWRSQ